jgi:ABC-type transport system involved in cytochrome bd biosynthesis fused ATPase/permease subunit
MFPYYSTVCINADRMNYYIVLQDCLMGMLKDKTILYVTHQVEFLPAADLILVSIKNTSVCKYYTYVSTANNM